MIESPPLAIYAHFPWCVQKCPYCDFNSHQAPDELPERAYVDALLADLAYDLPTVSTRSVVSIFLGGGTPSLFSPAAIERLLQGIKQQLPLSPTLEVTLEANPGSIEHGQFAEYRAVGVTRVSLGAQSFQARQLRQLGRIHGSDEIAMAVAELQRAGLDNFNLDLMYALPEQTPAQALADVRQALALAPAHISHYQLTLEPGTAFFHRPPSLPEEDDAYLMQEQCQALLAEAGYGQYEVSAYARPGRQALHNRNYWEFGDYLGLGAGAHGKLTTTRSIVRTERSKQPREYLGQPVAQRRQQYPVSAAQLPFEFMLNALRLTAGFTDALFEARTGLPWRSLQPNVALAQQRGLLQQHGRHWRATELGQRFLNDLIGLFLSDEPA